MYIKLFSLIYNLGDRFFKRIRINMGITTIDDYELGLHYHSPIPYMTRVQLYTDDMEVNEYILRLALHSHNEAIDIDTLKIIIEHDKSVLNNDLMYKISKEDPNKLFQYISTTSSVISSGFSTSDALMFDRLDGEVLTFIKATIT